MKRLVLSATTASALALAGLYAMGVHNPLPAHAGVTIPAPASDVAVRGSSATAVIAGGCFWGIEGVFENVAGVRIVTAGYAGGSAAAANYGAVGGGRSGHAEAVRIVYDPRVVSYGQLLHIFFSVAHDPTQLNRQGPDQGSQYRSAIFPQNGEQRRGGAGLCRAARPVRAIRACDRHPHRERRLLAGRGLSPELHAPKPAQPLHHGSRRSEAARPADDFPPPRLCTAGGLAPPLPVFPLFRG